MQIIFESRDADGTRMRDVSIDRMRFALRRLSGLVPHAKIQLSDVNGPRGGVDKLCQVELKTNTAGTLVISALANNWRTALDQTLTRATKVLTHTMQRKQKPSRERGLQLKDAS
jgi:hypothetical protein